MATRIESTSSALTPVQTVSWPVPTPKTSVSGDPFPPARTAQDRTDNLIELARQRFKLCVDAESAFRSEALTDFEFYNGMQWGPAVKAKREKAPNARPCLTINRMPGFVKHVVNNMRQSRPAIKIDPTGDGADEDQAQIRQGLIRHIEVNSQADTVYDTSFKHMCIGGLGWMRIVPDWAGPESMDQELFIRWVPNPFSVYHDPDARQPDWSDMRYAFVVQDLTRAEFIAQFGEDTEAGGLANFQSLGDHMPNWFPDGKIRIAEYFHIEMRKDMLLEIRDGGTRLLSEMEDDELPNEEDITAERECMVPEVHWDLINGIEKLRHRIFKGHHIPLIPVIGDDIEINGNQVICGMIRHAREPQRAYNFAYSTFMETMSLAPRSQWVAAVGQVDPFRDIWEMANTSPMAVLPYVMVVDESGRALPPPERVSANPDIQAAGATMQMCDQQMKSVFSIFDASLGQKGPQESGLAINARKIESDTGTYDWGDNFIRSLRRVGIILNNLLPYYYNTPGRILQIIRDDDSRAPVTMNQEHHDPKTNKVKIYDLSKGKFSVVVSTGPTADTKRQEARQGMIDFFTKLDPQALQVCAPTLVKAFDFPDKDILYEKLNKALPPDLRDPDPDGPQTSPEDQQTMASMNGMIQQLTQVVHVLSDKSAQEERKQQWETFRTDMNNQVKLAVADIAAKNDQAMYMNDMIQKQLERVLARIEGAGGPLTPPQASQPQAPQGPPTSSPTGSGTTAGTPSGNPS